MIEVGIAACSSMESFEFGDVLFAVGLIVGAIGLRALMFAYLGTLAFRLPRRGRPLTVAFTKSDPALHSRLACARIDACTGVGTDRCYVPRDLQARV